MTAKSDKRQRFERWVMVPSSLAAVLSTLVAAVAAFASHASDTGRWEVPAVVATAFVSVLASVIATWVAGRRDRNP